MAELTVEAALHEAVRAAGRLIDDRAARHEATHVVTAWAAGVSVGRVTIEPSSAGGGSTALALRPPSEVLALIACSASLVAGTSVTDDELLLELVGADGIAASRARARLIVEHHVTAIETVAASLIASRTLDAPELEVLRLQVMTGSSS